MTERGKALELRVNGRPARVEVWADQTLLSALRESLDLTGTKYGCGEQQCGACVVWFDGRAIPSCGMLATEAAGKEVLTIEGLAQDGRLHPVQQAFVDAGAMQCGYCTPGMIMEAVALLERSPRPSRDEIMESMERHICRCGLYARIVGAVEMAAERLEDAETATP